MYRDEQKVQWNINRIICVFLRQRESEKKGKNRIVLEIRAMQAEDLEAVVRTESQIFSRPWSRKGFEDALRQKETIYLVAYEKDILAGYCGLLQSFDEADITNVAVVEKFRKKGLPPNFWSNCFCVDMNAESKISHWKCGLAMHLLSIYMKNLGLSVPVSDRIFTRNQKKMH